MFFLVQSVICMYMDFKGDMDLVQTLSGQSLIINMIQKYSG